MKNLLLSLLILAGTGQLLIAQDAQLKIAVDDPTLPYYEIPENPETFTAETVAARMIDGLGFRYYWATEGLRPEDLSYQPSEGARTSEETIDHILGLTNIILNSVKQVPNDGGGAEAPTTFDGKRKRTLENLQEASNILKSGSGTLDEYPIIFQRGESRSELPFWNQINGPISDALWHVGQVVTFRRSSGNPFNSKVSVLSGKVRQ
ncbi:hypothetical protein [Flavilitoribacter nigricans]|uniref:DinB family protein n=1 Tax=Flavilitoribacter nigricans (strain ATCC 23147 / DSM 23189 / NBRC 102662 / NCIMB 1420 / SS-2) TaxID=1122177 RepID=A0A2D0MY35_FLAN2|nr:hypothetical protein [Flavilitoribacter nigricans]PHN01155.1 hypothetical protein CRP01_38415 [Flavilitoribacter nigricans DSM 23189 = NBRC 102662]